MPPRQRSTGDCNCDSSGAARRLQLRIVHHQSSSRPRKEYQGAIYRAAGRGVAAPSGCHMRVVRPWSLESTGYLDYYARQECIRGKNVSVRRIVQHSFSRQNGFRNDSHLMQFLCHSSKGSLNGNWHTFLIQYTGNHRPSFLACFQWSRLKG